MFLYFPPPLALTQANFYGNMQTRHKSYRMKSTTRANDQKEKKEKKERGKQIKYQNRHRAQLQVSPACHLDESAVKGQIDMCFQAYDKAKACACSIYPGMFRKKPRVGSSLLYNKYTPLYRKAIQSSLASKTPCSRDVVHSTERSGFDSFLKPRSTRPPHSRARPPKSTLPRSGVPNAVAPSL